MHLPVEIAIVFLVLIIGSWFLLGDKSTVMDKLMIIIFIVGFYIGYRIVFKGPSIQQLLSPYIH